MSNKKSGISFSSIFPYIAIPIALVLGAILYMYVLGSPSNFEGGDPELGHPQNALGIMYKGGPIIGLLIALNIIVITFFLERLISMIQVRGKGGADKFISTIKGLLKSDKVDEALKACDVQQGSIGAVMRSGLTRYKALSADSNVDKDTKVRALKEELEESTSLELPMLSKNLVILSTCASLGVLVGLMGTVSGMIKAFAAMAEGVPDPAQLSVGISEALNCTLLGIVASALAILAYNFFSTRVDQLTHGIDEAGFAVTQIFAQKH